MEAKAIRMANTAFKHQRTMNEDHSELESQLQEREAGIADLVAAYEAVEVPYFAAVTATTPVVQQFIASNSSDWMPNADLG